MLRFSCLKQILMVTVLASCGQAFVFDAFTAFPNLKDLAKDTGRDLNVRMDIGDPKRGSSTPRLFLDGLALNLLQENAVSGSHVGLPGANGPHPQTSSGAKNAKVTCMPSFIGTAGLQKVLLERAVWEIVWPKHSNSGNLICGFDVPQEVVRNDASARLPSGCIYVVFPVWTPELLAEMQAQKASAERRAKEHELEMNQKLQEMQKEGNVIKKLFLYRDAAEEHEKAELTGARYYRWIPSSDGIISFHDGLLVGTLGSVYSVKNDFFRTKTLIGQARLHENSKPENEVLRP